MNLRRNQRLDSRPAGPCLADYGDYEHPGYGRIAITHAAGKLHWAFRGMSGPLAHRHNDTFESPGGLLALSFSTDREGNIASMAVPFEPLVKDIAFARIAAIAPVRLPSALHRHLPPRGHARPCEGVRRAKVARGVSIHYSVGSAFAHPTFRISTDLSPPQ
jgi:hypothetical protein